MVNHGNEHTVTISSQEYLKLKSVELKLGFLEAGGVDNWEWYGESLNPHDEESFTEALARLTKEIEAG